MMKINDRTPFHLISTIFLFVTMVLSFVSTFQTKTNLNDFFQIHMKNVVLYIMILRGWIKHVGIIHK